MSYQYSSSNDNAKYPAILLVGKIGSGKSTLANLLLGGDKFIVSDSSKPLTEECQMASTIINEKIFTIIDTPGIFRTDKTNQEILRDMALAISQCTSGIQAIIVVMGSTRFTKEQRDTIDQIIEFFGKKSLKHMIAVFTRCNKASTKDPDLLFNSLVPEQKEILSQFDDRFIISPNLDIFGPDDPIVVHHMTKLKNYIVDFPDLYIFDRMNILSTYTYLVKDYFSNLIEKNGCFAADSKVTLRNGKVIKISELVIGDYVCCGFENGKQVFSEVFIFIHADHNSLTEFQLIDFMKQDGSLGTLCITPEHHIFMNNGETSFAKNVIPDKTKLFVSDGEKLVSVTTTRITKERRKGYYSPLTRSGTILVDEVLCSCYASAPPYQSLINYAFAPLKIYTKIFPSKHLEKEIHPYAKFLNKGRGIVEFLDLNFPKKA